MTGIRTLSIWHLPVSSLVIKCLRGESKNLHALSFKWMAIIFIPAPQIDVHKPRPNLPLKTKSMESICKDSWKMEARGHASILCSRVKLDGGETVIGIYVLYYKPCGHFSSTLNSISLPSMTTVYNPILTHHNTSSSILIKIHWQGDKFSL